MTHEGHAASGAAGLFVRLRSPSFLRGEPVTFVRWPTDDNEACEGTLLDINGRGRSVRSAPAVRGSTGGLAPTWPSPRRRARFLAAATPCTGSDRCLGWRAAPDRRAAVRGPRPSARRSSTLNAQRGGTRDCSAGRNSAAAASGLRLGGRRGRLLIKGAALAYSLYPEPWLRPLRGHRPPRAVRTTPAAPASVLAIRRVPAGA